MKENVITIKKLIDFGLDDCINYQNKFIVCRINDLRLFSYPCHLNAITIIICMSGELDCIINLNNYKITKGSVMINCSENIIEIKQTKELTAFAILISNDYLQELSLGIKTQSDYYRYDVQTKGAFSLPNEEMESLSSYLSIFKQIVNSEVTKSSDELIRHFVSTFITQLMTLHHYYHKDLQLNGDNCSRNQYLIFEKFIELVSKYHGKERNLQFYADKMGITSKYLSIVVKKTSGRKAIDWIYEFVILEAKSMLKYSGKNVKEISTQLNFASQSAFGKYFKTKVGMSPKEFLENTSYPI